MRKRKRRIRLIHRGIDYRRVESDLSIPGRENSLEVAFADEWEGTNKPSPGLNHGHGTLQDLMFGRPDYLGHHQLRLIITKRDAAVAATAIQWLGTNCGSSWLASTVKRAGWLLLHPSEAEHYRKLDHDMRHREQALRQTALQQREEMGKREQAMRTREAEIEGKRVSLMLEEAMLRRAQETFIAVMLMANKVWFNSPDPLAERPIRMIELENAV